MVAILETLDWTVVGVYAAIVIGLGAWHARRAGSAEDHLVGGRRLPWWAIGISLIATSFSSISLVALSNHGATSGMAYWQLQLGDLLGMTLVAIYFLPRFQKKKLFTAYEFLELRFGRLTSRIASALFLVTVLARAGILLFTTALPLSLLMEQPLTACILGVGIAAILYSAIGGMRAVVWTDTIQFLLIIGSVAICFVVIASDLGGGGGAIVDAATRATPAPFPDFDPDPSQFPTFWTCLLGYGAIAVSVFGTNQQSVQRFLATKNVRAARRAGFLGWGLGAVIAGLCLVLGASIAAWSAQTGTAVGSDNILASFVGARLPVGLKGVVVAGLLAAAMSSMDSAIHSMATSTWVDFLRPRGAVAEDKRVLRTMMVLTAFYGACAIVAGLYAASQGTDIIATLLRWMGFLLGPMLGLFLLALFTRSVRQLPALVGLAAGYGAAAYLSQTVPKLGGGTERWIQAQGLSPYWTCGISALAALSVALLAAGLTVRDGD